MLQEEESPAELRKSHLTTRTFYQGNRLKQEVVSSLPPEPAMKAGHQQRGMLWKELLTTYLWLSGQPLLARAFHLW